jgi:hypothetical protein
MADPRSALEMGRRSAASGDTEEGPGYLTDLFNRIRELATIQPSPTGDRVENAGQLVPYLLPTAGASSAIRALTSRLRGAPRAVSEIAPAGLSELGDVNPAFADVQMPAVIETAPPPTGPPAARGFDLGAMPTEMSSVPTSKSKAPGSITTLKTKTGVYGPPESPAVEHQTWRHENTRLNAEMKQALGRPLTLNERMTMALKDYGVTPREIARGRGQ